MFVNISKGRRREGGIILKGGRSLSVCDFGLDDEARRIFSLCGIQIFNIEVQYGFADSECIGIKDEL